MRTPVDFLPSTPQELLHIIRVAERSRKYVWTATRVLIEAAHERNWVELDHRQCKAASQGITDLLESLANEGVLRRRPVLHSVGFGYEKAVDFNCPLRRDISSRPITGAKRGSVFKAVSESMLQEN